ncbi:hypothetical protein B9Z19DRAFT_1068881 [Tuber borchii]|uniref:Uncharacterized protein n=1 Tax=Tuber borchii TaxID=42251 RepID=A0A2T6ZDK1_TUBBO|nr:hypothetical protein B9Z19DRAFT_1068881 [Tuber borchii]
MNDVCLLLLHINGEIKIIIVLSFMETKTPNCNREEPARKETEEEISEAQEEIPVPEKEVPELEQEMQETIVQKAITVAEEQLMIQCIKASTNKPVFVQKLIDLNGRNILKHHLIKDLGTILHVYQVSKNLKNVVESFTATVLPPPKDESTDEQRVQIMLPDIFSSSIPKGLQPQDKIIFTLPILQAIVNE